MHKIIIAKPKRLDEVVYEHYKDVRLTNKVLECNAHLAHKLILEVGDEVALPTFPAPKKQSKRLWD